MRHFHFLSVLLLSGLAASCAPLGPIDGLRPLPVSVSIEVPQVVPMRDSTATPITLAIRNGFDFPIVRPAPSVTFTNRPDEPPDIVLIEATRDGAPLRLDARLRMISYEGLLSPLTLGRTTIPPGGVLRVHNALGFLMAGWPPGHYRIRIRIISLEIDAQTHLSVDSEPCSFEVRE